MRMRMRCYQTPLGFVWAAHGDPIAYRRRICRGPIVYLAMSVDVGALPQGACVSRDRAQLDETQNIFRRESKSSPYVLS